MADAYILKNQFDLFLDKHGQWVDHADPASLYRTVHKDEAINIMVEHSVKNPELRIKVETCGLNHKGHLALTDEFSSAAGIDPMAEHLFADEGDIADGSNIEESVE